MATVAQVIIPLSVVYFILFLICWFLAGRMKIAFNMFFLMAFSLIINSYLMLQIQPDSAINAIIISGLPFLMMFLLLVRYNQMVKDPYKTILREQELQIEQKTFALQDENVRRHYPGELNNILKGFYRNSGNFVELIENVQHNSDKLGNSSRGLVSISHELSTHTNENVDDIDTIIQSVVLLDESIQNIVDDVRSIIQEISMKFGDIKGSLSHADRISDQTNLLAVNAAIEAAHYGTERENFDEVASSIQRLSSRSRETTDKLIKEINLVQSLVDSRLKSMLNQTETMEDALVQIAELANSASSFIHTHVDQTNKLFELTQELDNATRQTTQKTSEFVI